MIDEAGHWPYLSWVWYLGILLMAIAVLASVAAGLHYGRRGQYFDGVYWGGWMLGAGTMICLYFARQLGVGGP